MQRRNFIRAAATVGAVAWVAPVHKLFSAPMQTYPNQIPFVAGPELSGFTAQDIDALFAINPAYTPQDQTATYPQSVASGDPQANGIVLWTRIDPSAMSAPSGGFVAWQIAADPTFAAILVQGVAPVDPARDNTVKLPVANAVLSPYTVYYYRFLYNLIPSRTGRFKTLPAATDQLAQLNIAYVVCQDFNNGYYTALSYLALEDVDCVVHLGDYIYETITQVNATRAVPPFPSGGVIPQTVEDYRHLYQVYRGDLNQQAVHENFAYIQLWDDHEFANDCHQDFHPDDNDAPDSATTPAARTAPGGEPGVERIRSGRCSLRPHPDLGAIHSGLPQVQLRHADGPDCDR